MSDISFLNFARWAQELSDYTMIAGRYHIQTESEKLIFADIIQKMNLPLQYSLLDIGWGPGNLAIPLSSVVHKIYCIDNKAMLNKFKERCPEVSNIHFVEGNSF